MEAMALAKGIVVALERVVGQFGVSFPTAEELAEGQAVADRITGHGKA